MSNIPNIPNQKEYKDLTPFDLVLLQKFPFIEEDFDAINLYGILSKIKDYLNQVISNEQIVTENQENVYNSFVELHDYVNDYFTNLDVQEQINNKLDDMYSSGQLTALLQPLLIPLENQISSLASGSPIPVSSTSQMTNTSKVYVNTTDGNWYYYNGTSWVSGGVYQATQIQDNSLDFFQKLKNVGFLNNGLINIEKTWENGGLNPNTRRRNK